MTIKQELEKLLLREKPVKLLLSLRHGQRPKYVSIMAKEVDCTYSHTVKLLSEFERLGLIFFDKKGRIKFVDLTKEGLMVSEKLEELMKVFSRIPEKQVE